MSPSSPTDAEAALLSLVIKAAGAPIDDVFQVVSVDTWSAVNKVPKARIVFYDGSPADQRFPISSGGTFLPGTEIEVTAGYDDQKESIFSGIVIGHGIEITRNGASTLVVDVADKAIKMTVARKSAVSEKVTDSDLIGKLLSASGLSKDVGSTTKTHDVVVQYDATDWDMMLMRAEMNGMLVTTSAGKVTVKAPDTSQQPKLTVAYGDSIVEFRAEMDAVRQLPESAVKSYAWDSAQQKLLQASPSGVSVKEAGNVDSATLARVCGISAFPQLTGASVTTEELQAWSSAGLLRSKLAKVRGRVRFQGSALAEPGTMLAISGVGRFNGNVFVSAVHHDFRQGRWYTDVEFGLTSDSFASSQAIAQAPAAGHLSPIRGLHTGVVQKVAADEAGAFRILVTLPITQAATGVWARLSTFFASNGVGAVFYPEVGDEVIVGFMNEDPRFPIVLGSLYGKKMAPGFKPEEANNVKGIITRSKMEMKFDEEKKIITIKTPAGHQIALNDETSEITIVDKNKSSVKLDASGITLDSAKDISIKAKGNIAIEATGNLTMKATGNATCQGVNVEMKAQAGFSAQGNATAELKASGAVTVKGSVVMIN